MTYERIEDLYLERLAPLTDYGFVIQAMPDAKEDMERPATHSRVTVAYGASRYGDKTSPGRPEILAMGMALEEEFVELNIVVEARRKRGPSGLYEGLELSRRLLHGWVPGHGMQPTASMTVEPIGYVDGFYSFSYTVLTSLQRVPLIDEYGRTFGATSDDAPPGLAPLVSTSTTV
jgi:hypothetical protein